MTKKHLGRPNYRPCITWGSVASFTPWLLYPRGKDSFYPLNRRSTSVDSVNTHRPTQMSQRPQQI